MRQFRINSIVTKLMKALMLLLRILQYLDNVFLAFSFVISFDKF